MITRNGKGNYFYENKGNEVINGCSDWERLNIYQIDYKTWGACLDKGMTFKTFTSLKDARNYFDI